MFRLQVGGLDFEPAHEYNHMTTARTMAREEAKAADEDVTILLGDRPMLIVHPDGSFSAPPTRPTNCTRISVPDQPCFCPTCRVIRKEARA